MATPKSKQKANKDLSRVLTPEFRVSYPHVFKAQAIKPTDKPKFSVTMLFPKTADLSSLKEAMRQAKIAQFGSKENWPDDLESPVVDGDNPKHADKEGYKGHWVIKASTNEDQRPGVVDENVEPIVDQSKFYPGCYARAYIYAYVWEYMGKQGVGFILDHVQKLRDGKSFGGKKPADQVFTPVGTGGDDSDFEEETEDMDFR
jgi:hypothetical protein